MKKFILLFFVLFVSFPLFAQWKYESFRDNYTDELNEYLSYDIPKKSYGLAFYPGIGLGVFLAYDSTDNFELWWDIQIDYNGSYEYESEVGFNFLGNSPDEYVTELPITHERDIDYPNSLMFKFFIYENEDEELLEMLKKNSKLNIKYYDIVRGRENVLNISLVGFTKAYNRIRNK